MAVNISAKINGYSILNNLNVFIGKGSAWLLFVMMCMMTAIVLLRYGFGISLIAMQELVAYAHATAFLLGAAFTLKSDEHVRVDIFYTNMSARSQAWVNCLGTLFLLLPFACFLLYGAWHYFIAAWSIQETSSEAGGLAFLFVLKAMMPLAAALLIYEALLIFYQQAKVVLLRSTDTQEVV